MNFQAGDLIITKNYFKHCKKRLATIIQVHEPESSDDWDDPDNMSISFQYCDTGETDRINIKYFTHNFLDSHPKRERWLHIPVKK
jgi:hypothetical protein